jgi:uncharacterized protein
MYFENDKTFVILSSLNYIVMDVLYNFHDNMVRQAGNEFYRFLYGRVNWDERMIAIRGPRGAGKTTMMLQRIRYDLQADPTTALYLSADHHWFYTHTLAETADDYVKSGGKWLFIDEVHKYPNWSREIKNIYDAHPDLKLVLSASSALDLHKGEADLSRRLLVYNLPGLSFREYLDFYGTGKFSPCTLQEIISQHVDLAHLVNESIRPLPHFRNYLQYGYLPFYRPDNAEEYHLKLLQVIGAVIESDISYIAGYNAGTARKLKKFLGILSGSVPFKPNIASLARKVDVSRDSIYEWFILLEKARLLNLLIDEGKSTAALQKPEKVFLENTNFSYALRQNPDVGNLRETFMLNQLVNAGLETWFPEKSDFLASGIYIEVGGKNKPAAVSDSMPITAADDIEAGYGRKIPLWLFGFLY